MLVILIQGYTTITQGFNWFNIAVVSPGDALTASAATDTVRLGGAIAARVRQDGHTSIRTLAPPVESVDC